MAKSRDSKTTSAENEADVHQLYVVTNPILRTVNTDRPSKLLEHVPWAVSGKTSISSVAENIEKNDLGAVAVFDNEGSVIGIVTDNLAVAFCRRKKKLDITECRRQCALHCATLGGCKSVLVDSDGNCLEFVCKDEANTSPIEDLFE